MEYIWYEILVPFIVLGARVLAFIIRGFADVFGIVMLYGFTALIVFAIVSAPVAIILGVVGQAQMTIDLYRLLGRSIGRAFRKRHGEHRSDAPPTEDVTVRREPQLGREDIGVKGGGA